MKEPMVNSFCCGIFFLISNLIKEKIKGNLVKLEASHLGAEYLGDGEAHLWKTARGSDFIMHQIKIRIERFTVDILFKLSLIPNENHFN